MEAGGEAGWGWVVEEERDFLGAGWGWVGVGVGSVLGVDDGMVRSLVWWIELDGVAVVGSRCGLDAVCLLEVGVVAVQCRLRAGFDWEAVAVELEAVPVDADVRRSSFAGIRGQEDCPSLTWPIITVTCSGMM